MSKALKSVLRKQIIAQRRITSKTTDISSIVPRMVDKIKFLIQLHSTPESSPSSAARVMSGYYPVWGEFDVLPVLQEFARESWTIALPVTEQPQKPLRFACWKNMDRNLLVKGKYNIPVPAVSYTDTAGGILLPNVLLVPLVGFTKNCDRLGYGGGYYDKTIAELRSLKKLWVAIGVAFESQRCNRIPVENLDEPLDAIVTEKKTYMRNIAYKI